MSGKSDKKLRRMLKKNRLKIFSDFAVEISAMPFWARLKFCLNMAFIRHELQKDLKDEIAARRTHNYNGEEK
jgi:hypothetical protein